MKAITTLWGTVLACIAFTGQAAAQEAEEFYPTGTYWEETFYDYASPESYCQLFGFTVGKDTVVAGRTYKYVDAQHIEGQQRFDVAPFLIRQDGSKVYYRQLNGVEDEVLQYDFDWETTGKVIVGHDEMTGEPVYEAIDAIVTKEMEDGNLYDCVEKEYLFPYTIIKGIGTTHWGLFRDRYLVYTTTTSTVRKFVRGGNTIFQQEQLPSPSASGQEPYMPLLVDGKTWTYSEGNFFAGYRDIRQTVDGDTLIDSKIWKKIYIESPVGTERRFEKAMREEGSKVYERQPVYEQGGGYREVLFADFSAPVGSQFIENEGMFVEVTATKNVELENVSRRQVVLEQHQEGYDYHPNEDPTSYWTEGIGGDCGIYQSVKWLGTVGNTCTLLTCYEGDVCIYKHPQAVGIGAVVRPSSPLLYDLQGRQLHDKPERGMYIQA